MEENEERGSQKGNASARTPNDQRSDSHNPTSSDNKAATDNRASQLNPNNPAYRGSRGKK
jgi:hypothetical protein